MKSERPKDGPRVLRLEPIEYESLTDRVYRQIKARILSHEIPLGAKILDDDLAAQLGVSRTPVREAIRNLIHDGLVEAIPRSQTRVRLLTENDIEEIFDLRVALESLAIQKATERLSREQVHQLRQMHEAAELALKKGNVEPALEFDRTVHRTILEGSGNTRLQEMMVNINDYVTLFRSISARTPAHRGFNYKHREIVRALEREDAEAAARALADHILMAKEQTLSDFQQERVARWSNSSEYKP